MNVDFNKVYNLDCIDFLKSLPENSVDSIVTDPPAGISFMAKEWDSDKGGKDNWIKWMTSVMEECKRVLKPGGHALVWAIPRTSHWTTTAMEDAGFDIRDKIYHVFGTGFPKSLDISKAIDNTLGVDRQSVGVVKGMGKQNPQWNGVENGRSENFFKPEYEKTVATSPEAKQFSGWGTALKPAAEEWILARKPIEKGLSVAQNCMKWGTGGLNIDGCRIQINPIVDMSQIRTMNRNLNEIDNGWGMNKISSDCPQVVRQDGRFPSNLIIDDSEEIKKEFEKYGNSKSTGGQKSLGAFRNGDVYGVGKDIRESDDPGYGYQGSVSRFFYCAKANQEDRDEMIGDFEEKYQANAEFRPNHLQSALDGYSGKSHGRYTKRKNNHPTVKHTSLMIYLVRLITPTGGLVLDPFSGSGSTGKACVIEGFNFLGCELDSDFVEIANARIEYAIENRDKLVKKYSSKVDVVLPKMNDSVNPDTDFNDFF